jgi:adenylosuccinate synthase
MSQDILVGLQHGDEGKGKISKCLADLNNYDCFVRFNGGPNAGHTIIYNGEKIVTHQIPCGILHDKPCLISTDCVVDIIKLKQEILLLENKGIDVRNNLYISNMCHMITEENIIEDSTHNQVGTTCSGIGPTYSKRALRTGYIIQPNSKLYKLVEPFTFLQQFDNKDNRIFFEGAQGFELDINYGDYPYVTSSSCISNAIFLNGGDISKKTYIYGVCKLYDTYVGSKDFGEEGDIDLNRLGIIGEEYGSTTGRRRKCNWLNLKKLIRSCKINNVSTIFVNKCDIIQELGVFKLFDSNEVLQTFNNYDDMIHYIINHLELTKYRIIFSSSKEYV